MSFYDDASLIFLAGGEAGKDTKAYSIKPTNGDGDFTFSRGSNLTATRIDSNGLIEKGRENLLLQSNQFDTTWNLNNVSATSGQLGYDGSTDAWLLDISGGTSGQRIEQSMSFGGIQTFSVYAKAGTLNWIRVRGSSNTYFDLANGVIGTDGHIDSKIESIGNGWYRCSVVTQTSTLARIYLATDNGNVTQSSGSIYIQDVQLEQGLVATEPILSGATTGLAGILEDSPRFDYSGGASCPSLLLEPSRTNLIGYSEYYNDWDIKTNISFQVNEGISPEGLQNAQNIYPTSSGACFMYENASYTSGETYVYSVFAKSNGKDYLQITTSGSSFGTDYCTFDLSNGTIDNNGFTNADIEDHGNGWYRCYIVVSAIATSSSRIVIGLVPSATSSRLEGITANGTDGVLIYGIFNEQGSYPTSYIPNHSGGSVTREADSCLINPMSTEYSTNYTFYGEFERIVSEDEESILMQLYDGSASSTNQYRIMNRGNAQLRTRIYFSGSNTSIISDTDSFQLGQTIKWAVKYDREVIKVFIDGQEIGSTTQAVGGIDVISLARMKVKQILLFDSTLSDANLVTLTS